MARLGPPSIDVSLGDVIRCEGKSSWESRIPGIRYKAPTRGGSGGLEIILGATIYSLFLSPE